MCCQEMCRNGAVKMSGSRDRCCGRMAKSESSRYPSAQLNTWSAQISARNPAITTTASRSLCTVMPSIFLLTPARQLRERSGPAAGPLGPSQHPDRVRQHRADVTEHRGAELSVNDPMVERE